MVEEDINDLTNEDQLRLLEERYERGELSKEAYDAKRKELVEAETSQAASSGSSEDTTTPPDPKKYSKVMGIGVAWPAVIAIAIVATIITAVVVSAGIFNVEKKSIGVEDEEEVEMEEVIVFHLEQTDTIMVPGFGQIGGSATTITYDFPVEDNASRATIITTNQGNNVRPDIDLYIYGPDGSEVTSSSGATADEAVELDQRDIERHGYGGYTAEVRNYSNIAVTYEIVIDVYKEVPVNQTDEGG